MKILHTSFLVILAAMITFAFSPSATTTYQADIKKSVLKWNGKKITGEHYGAISLKEGQLLIENGKLTGGNFKIDMNSMTCEDLKDQEYNNKLIGHLKSDDFFNVKEYPEASIILKNVKSTGGNKYQISGDLTIKGITKPVEFPATIDVTSNTVNAKATIPVDRSKYDIRYGSNSFFDNLGDKAIDDIFTMTVEIVANKKAQ